MSDQQQYLNNTTSVVIRKNYFGEYLVPEENGETYYTDDRDDAVATACFIYGADCRITYRTIQ